METALVERHEVEIVKAPAEVLAAAQEAAKALQAVITGKRRPVVFNGETYLEFEDWQTVGKFYGLTAQVEWTKPLSEARESGTEIIGYEAQAIIVHAMTGQVISRAESMCMREEKNWAGKPLFQLRSMAQTRACAKAFRNVLAWVVVLAGFKPTPAEEMDGVMKDTSTSEKATISPPLPGDTNTAEWFMKEIREAKTKSMATQRNIEAHKSDKINQDQKTQIQDAYDEKWGGK